VSSRSKLHMLLAACCVALAACTAVHAEEAPVSADRTVESVESHLESTREISPQESTPPNADVPVGPGGAIFSPFTPVDGPVATSRRAVGVRVDGQKDPDSTATVIAVVACGVGLGVLVLVLR
jgi:hypothetical protein